ncbi:MAG TPA: heme-binding protein [Caulobacteraceae bacterium]|nr:heme-binding protein [Caulobacteraceae bacterium]
MSEVPPTASKPLVRASIAAATAKALIEAAEAKAREIGVPMVIAVVDESGVLKAFSRMDGAPLLSVDIAQDKAYTAAAYAIPTHAWFDFIKGDPPLLHGIVKTPRLVVFGGGYPVEQDGAVVGGIGVSGGHYEQDMAVATAALAILGG